MPKPNRTLEALKFAFEKAGLDTTDMQAAVGELKPEQAVGVLEDVLVFLLEAFDG